MLDCSKQNVSYWSLHPYSTQSRMSIIHTVIIRAKSLFVLKDEEAEILANSAGLSLQFEGGYIIDAIGYNGLLKAIYDRAMISERMLRTYKKTTPTKQAIIALCVVLRKSTEELGAILHKYGYELSDSIIGDVVVK